MGHLAKKSHPSTSQKKYMLFDNTDVTNTKESLQVYFSNDVASIIIPYLMTTDDHLKRLIYKRFSICISTYRYTFEYVESWTDVYHNDNIIIYVGNANANVKKISRCKPYSIDVSFNKLWLFVQGSQIDIIPHDNDTLRNTIRKRMQFRFVANGEIDKKFI
jgi:hypothetical protein